MYALYDVINTIIFVVLAYFFLNTFLKGRNTKWYVLLSELVCWSIMEIAIVKILEFTLLFKAVFTVLCTFLFSKILFRDRMAKLLVLSIFEYMLLIVFDFAAYLLVIRFATYVDIYQANDSIVGIYGGTISQLLFLIMIIGLSLIFNKDDYKQIGATDFLKFSLFPIISISLFIVFSHYVNGKVVNEEEIDVYAYLSLVFLIANIYMYWLIKVDFESKIAFEKREMLSTHADELSKLYKEIIDEHKEIASIEHEYKNQMSLIASMVSAKKYDDLESYLNKKELSIIYSDVVNIGNPIASAIFNAKYTEAVRKGIQVRFDLDNITNLALSDSEIVIILSNLFNNAIEACSDCKNEKNISIKMKLINDTFFIDFTNTFNNEYLGNSFEFNTTKTDKKRHGFGLHNIRHIVESNDGQMDALFEGNRFSVRIIIPNIAV